ncbi:MAG: O-antigen ligase family protein [Candidatus Cloacimonetes bacterium]|nr:O-antigen ligase family protein [Candidatus Cloacimonadota bacterium]
MLLAIALFAFQIFQGELSLYVFLGLLFVWLSLHPTWPAAFFRLYRSKTSFSLEHAFNTCLCLYLGITLIQALLSPYHLRSMQVFFKLLAMYLLFMYLRFSSSKAERGLLYGVCLVAALLQVFGGVWQVFFDSTPMPLSWASTPGIADPVKRAFGLQPDPNVLGTFLGLMLLSLIAFQQFSEKLWIWPVSIFLGFGIILTQSRGALLAAMASLFVLWVLKRTGLHLILLVLLAGGMMITGRSRTLVLEDLGVNQRVELLSGIFEYIGANFIWGSGPGSFHLVYPEFRSLGGYYPGYAHNHILEVFCEQGAIGVVPLVLAIFILGVILWKRHSKTVLPLYVFCVLNSMVGHSFSLMNQSVVLVLLLGIGMAKHRASLVTVPWNFWFLVLFLPYGCLEILRPTLILNEKAYKEPYQWFSGLPAVIGLDLGYYQAVTLNHLEKREVDSKALIQNLRYNSLLREILPKEAELPWLAGRILQKAKKEELATVYFAKAHHLDPYGEKYAESYLRRLREEDKCDVLIPIAKSVLLSNLQYRRINPFYDRIFVLQLACYLRMGRLDELKDEFNSSVWADEEFRSQVRNTILEEVPDGL